MGESGTFPDVASKRSRRSRHLGGIFAASLEILLGVLGISQPAIDITQISEDLTKPLVVACFRQVLVVIRDRLPKVAGFMFV